MLTHNECLFSPERVYRYQLWRVWNPDIPFCTFIGLNPSTADETADDPTVRRCIGFAKRWGFGALCMTNIFAFRSTDPKVMLKFPSPVGEMNNRAIMSAATHPQCGMIVAAWGDHGRLISRGNRVMEMLERKELGLQVHCLGRNMSGQPKHPLYIRADAEPQRIIFSL